MYILYIFIMEYIPYIIVYSIFRLSMSVVHRYVYELGLLDLTVDVSKSLPFSASTPSACATD